MIQYQILQTSIMRIIWQTVRRITREILGVKGLTQDMNCKTSYSMTCTFQLYLLSLKFEENSSYHQIEKTFLYCEDTSLSESVLLILSPFLGQSVLNFYFFIFWGGQYQRNTVKIQQEVFQHLC